MEFIVVFVCFVVVAVAFLSGRHVGGTITEEAIGKTCPCRRCGKPRHATYSEGLECAKKAYEENGVVED